MTLEPTLDALSIDRAHDENLSAFVTLFDKWNRSINLSAASTRAEITEHLIDSLHVVPHLRALANATASRADRAVDAPTARVLDVGSGGGFPVVVAAICLPTVHFTSLEPVHKKHAFLRTAARELRLANLDPHAQRIEDHPSRDYDAATSRATFDLVEWLRTGLDRVRPGGIVLGFEAVPRTDLPPGVERHPYSLAGKQRAIVVARKP
jgi:16S rRNA (guanine527-N7)-methyltransferase